jgi:hypothetical protein
MAEMFILGLLAHLFADWFLQSDWQAAHKTNLKHPAAWVHFACHTTCMLVVWAPLPALIATVTHALIDTRKPLVWWRKMLRQKQVDPTQPEGSFWNQAAMAVAFWQDQAAHILILGILSIGFK